MCILCCLVSLAEVNDNVKKIISTSGKYISVHLLGKDRILTVCEIQVFRDGVDLRGKMPQRYVPSKDGKSSQCFSSLLFQSYVASFRDQMENWRSSIFPDFDQARLALMLILIVMRRNLLENARLTKKSREDAGKHANCASLNAGTLHRTARTGRYGRDNMNL